MSAFIHITYPNNSETFIAVSAIRTVKSVGPDRSAVELFGGDELYLFYSANRVMEAVRLAEKYNSTYPL